MEQQATRNSPRLSGVGQLYVTTVGATAVLSLLSDSQVWYLALIALGLPLSLLALWVGFYAGTAVAFVAGSVAGEFSWPVAIVWVGVWTATAWVNAQLCQKVLRAGWRTVAPRPRVEDPDDY